MKTNNKKTNFGDRLNSILKEKKISQSKLAEMTEISQGAISQYIIGTYKPKYDKIKAIAEALNVNVGYLIGLEDIKDKDPNLRIINNLIELTSNNKMEWEKNSDGYLAFMRKDYSVILTISDENDISLHFYNELEEENKGAFINSDVSEYKSLLEDLLHLVEYATSNNAYLNNILSVLDEMMDEQD
ncbi:helix-turn-helix transcriptional regulator [Helcococcus bovis]|uniref:helix-turn-helix domain-containing protein n=1 Tax=Helcococcus bovis TaxID=3153252 RepID=UPI0038BD0D79